MRGYERSMQRVIGQTNRSAQRIERRFERANQRVERGFAMMGRAGQAAFAALAAAGSAYVARELMQVADAVNQLRGRISLYTSTAEETEQVLSALFDRSRLLGASFDGLAETYARIVPAQSQLNLSTEQMLDLSEAVASAFIVSGASAEEARNATLQLSQAFASGELRGEELRSVMEQGQRIMMALSRATGQTTGGLREMAEQGQLTADVVANALLQELPTLRQEMESMPVTVARGMQSLRSAVTELVANVDRATGASENLGEAIQGMAEAVDGFNQRLNETPEAKLARLEEAAANLAQDFPNASRALQFFTDGVSSGVETLSETVVNQAYSLKDAVIEGTVALSELLTGDLGESRRAEQIANLRREVEQLERSYMRAGLGDMFDRRLSRSEPSDPSSDSNDGDEDEGSTKPAKSAITATGSGLDDKAPDMKGEALAAEKRAAVELGEEMARAWAEASLEEQAARSDEFSRGFASSMAGAVRAMADGNAPEYFAKRLQDALYNRLFTVFENLGQVLFKSMSSKSGGGGLGGFVASLFSFGGGKAAGGPVDTGRSYRVGERGPETFVPLQRGMIVPNGGPLQANRGVTVVNQFHLHAEGAVMTDELLSEMDQKAMAAAQGAVAVTRRDMAGARDRASKRLR